MAYGTGPGGSSYPPPSGRTNTLAVVAFVLAIAGICSQGCLNIVALVLGIIALNQINASGGAEGGRGMAVAAIWISVIVIAASVLLSLFGLGLLALFSPASSAGPLDITPPGLN